MTARGLGPLVVCLLLILGAGSVAAQPDPLAAPADKAARKHFELGNKLFREHGDYEGAIVEFKAGVLIEPAPAFHYNLGLCYRKLGQYEDAIFHYKRFIALGKLTGENRETVETLIVKMEDELARAASTAEPNEPAPGVRLAAERPAITATNATTATTSARRPVSPRWYQDGIGWGLAGGGFLAAGLGGGFLARAEALDGEAARESDQVESQRLLDRGDTWRSAGVITAVAGGLVLAAGIVKLTIAPRSPVEVIVAPSEGGVSAHALARF